ncbi:unnamed protein product [Amoebophrya sp. A120]|nr:unnamed protein product [Amoebophrya sp. A120]|eukprot:GSA120T00016394001.1
MEAKTGALATARPHLPAGVATLVGGADTSGHRRTQGRNQSKVVEIFKDYLLQMRTRSWARSITPKSGKTGTGTKEATTTKTGNWWQARRPRGLKQINYTPSIACLREGS